MVTHASERDRQASLVKQWAARLPVGTAELTEEGLPYETVVRLQPSNPRASHVEFRISDYNTFGLYFGKGFSFEDIHWSDDLVLDICESIRRGRIRERVWERRNKIVKTSGELTLSSGRLRDTGSRSWASLLTLGKGRLVQYEPWD